MGDIEYLQKTSDILRSKQEFISPKDTYDYLKDILEKVRVGDPLNDNELMLAHDFYRDLAEKLTPLGLKFSLACNEVVRIFNELEGYRRARNRRGPFISTVDECKHGNSAVSCSFCLAMSLV